MNCIYRSALARACAKDTNLTQLLRRDFSSFPPQTYEPVAGIKRPHPAGTRGFFARSTMAQPSSSASTPLQFPNPTRLRSYLFRLPLFTRIVLFTCVAFWLLELQTVWSVTQWGALIPQEVGLQSMYRLNTFPFIHLGFIHMFLNVLCLVPLMERFEKEQGTLVSVLMFVGRKLTVSLAFGKGKGC